MRNLLPILLSLALCLALIGGCGAMQVALVKKDLNVQTSMSESIFMDLEHQRGRRVYVDVRNTADKDIRLQDAVCDGIIGRGYELVSIPADADYLLQVNILSCSMTNPTALEKTVSLGYGAGTGAVAGALVGMGTTSWQGVATGAGVGALAGGALEMVAGSLVRDVTYALVTDVQIIEKTQGDEHIYRTRMGSFANKVNLKFEDAQAPLEDAMARSIAGIF